VTDNLSTAHVETRATERGPVAVITIDNPPVNAGNATVRSDILAALEKAVATEGLAAVILTGANGNFVAGSDIREFDGDPVPPHLPDVIARIEAAPVPVVAAIKGAALGGGYELALGCDARVVAPNAVLGLTETTLGLIPGAGGTYRLPRLVDAATAIGLITSGRRVKSDEAIELGMADRLAEGDVVEAAIAFATSGISKRRLTERPSKAVDAASVDAAAEKAMKRAGRAAAIPEAIEAVRRALTHDAPAALDAERDASLRLRRQMQSRALRHLFHAERAAQRAPEGVSAREVKTVGIAGAGRMGRGIAVAFASRGYNVRLHEANPEVLVAALGAIADVAGEMAARGRVANANVIIDRVIGVDLAGLGACDLIVEAIFEDMATKQALFADLERLVSPDTILATNTSYLDIDEMSAGLKHRDRVAGLHFFSPAHVLKLVEVVRAGTTSDETLATLLKVCRRLGKVSVVARVGEGFIGNRIFSAYRTQCEFLLEEGSLPADVDRAMTDFGMRMGPFAVFDLTGLEVAWATRKRLAPTRDPEARYVAIPDLLCEAGRLGRRVGMGWYDYTDGKALPSPQVREIIEAASAEKGLERRAISDDEIRDRLLAAMANEACKVLDEGVAARPGDIDLVMVHGYGFPALEGGLMFWAAAEPREAFLASVAAMAERSGKGVTVAPNLKSVLAEIAG